MAQKNMQDFLIEQNTKMVQAMTQISDAIRAINDTNTLHKDALIGNTEVVKKMVEVNSTFLSFFRVILIVLLAAIIVLAGAEKALKFLPL